MLSLIQPISERGRRRGAGETAIGRRDSRPAGAHINSRRFSHTAIITAQLNPSVSIPDDHAAGYKLALFCLKLGFIIHRSQFIIVRQLSIGPRRMLLVRSNAEYVDRDDHCPSKN